MTKAQEAEELCRRIRGYAANNPNEFARVCRQVDELRAGRPDSQPKPPTTPESEHTEPQKRKRGRPRKVRTEG